MKSDYDDAKNNFSATVNPTANDDLAAGYDVGSRWLNPVDEQMFVCTCATTGYAVWKKVTDQGGGTPSWGSIQGTLSNQTDLNSALNGKAPTSHAHVISDTTGLQTALDGKLATTVLSGLSKITVGSSAPGSPTTGDLWIDTN
jgi:hypothetical protein